MQKYDYISNNSSLLNIQKYILDEGKGKGTSMIRVSNAAGLEMHISPDRSMDIFEVRYKGDLINYFSATGMTNPSYYEARGHSWLRSFYGGFLVTCGLNQVGEPCIWGDEEMGLHGRISNCPAIHVNTDVKMQEEKLIGTVSGVVKQASQQGENIELRREYLFEDSLAEFTITDYITNLSSKPTPFLILYHINFGFPFLSKVLKLDLPIESTKGFDQYSESNTYKYANFDTEHELTLIHKLKPNIEDQLIHILLKNETTCVEIIYDKANLPMLAQWNLLQKRDYVMALEPTNSNLRGVKWEDENGTLQQLKPYETQSITIKFRFASNK